MITTPKQDKAIKLLEDALKAVKASGIVLYGMNETLYVITRKDNDLIGTDGYPRDFCSTPLMDGWEERSSPIEDHGAYIDSGGW